MVPPNYVLATLIWIGFMLISCRNFNGHQIRAQLEFNGTESFRSCKFPATLLCTLTTSGLVPDLPRLVQYTIKRSWNSTGNLPSWLSRRLSEGNMDQSAKAQIERFVHYESVTNDFHISAKCTAKSNHPTSFTFTFVGIIIYNSEPFIIRPHSIFPSSPTRPLDVVIDKIHESIPLSAEKSVPSQFEPHKSLSPTVRSRRALPDLTTFTIELLAVVDYSVYTKWQSRSRAGSDADSNAMRLKDEIKKYYRHVADGVDSRYRNIAFTDFTIRVKLVDVIIIEQKLLHPGDSGSNKINADTALQAFRNWTNATQDLPSYDHAILFVGYDLYTNTSKDNNTVSHTSGLAYIGTMCQPGDSVSVVEEQGGFQSIGTAAHELGHSLGALHDGEQNPCRSEDRYIMAASGFGPVPSGRQHNPWRFSPCSVEYFRGFIASHITTIQTDDHAIGFDEEIAMIWDGSMCLLDSEATRTSAPAADNVTMTSGSTDDDTDLPGQHYSPDAQCRLIWGPESYLCRGSEFGDPDSLCTSMYCRDPTTANDCVLHTAARGTSCGDKKWCMDGKCEFSEKAPAKQAACILGDQPGTAFNGLTCEELVEQRPSYCYQDKVRARCCQACGRKLQHRKGCEFGNRIQGCKPWHCTYASRSATILSDCCGTCNIGDTTLSTPAPTRVNDDTPSETVTQSVQMPDCHDDGLISGLTCREYVQTYGSYICYYKENAKTHCCSTCAEIRSNTEGCAYGDKTPMLCAKMANITELSCSSFGKQCCESCIEDVDQPSSAISVNVFGLLGVGVIYGSMFYIVEGLL